MKIMLLRNVWLLFEKIDLIPEETKEVTLKVWEDMGTGGNSKHRMNKEIEAGTDTFEAGANQPDVKHNCQAEITGSRT